MTGRKTADRRATARERELDAFSHFDPFRREFVDHTTVHPLGLAIVLTLGLFALFVARRYAAVPILLMVCFIAPAQRIVVFGLDFDFTRLMILFGLVRVALKPAERRITWNTIDTYFVLWAAVSLLAYNATHQSSEAFIYSLAVLFDSCGLYFFFRCVVRTLRDLDTVVDALRIVCIPVALIFLLEHATGHNIFSVFGGVPENTVIREGRLRCQGAFPHPIIAGCFFASLLPLIAAGCWGGRRRAILSLVAMISAVLVVILTASSTPLMALAAAGLGATLYLVRRQLTTILWAALAGLIALHLVMKAPVWHLLGRIPLISGSTGWHRVRLIDAAIANFSDWALTGTRSTAHWGYFLFDTTNHYVAEGVRGGLATLVLFVVIIALSYRAVALLFGRCGNSARARALVWALGVALFVHNTAFLGVAYFGQAIVPWFMLLAIIASLASTQPHRRRARRPRVARPPRRLPIPAVSLDSPASDRP